MRGKDFLTYRKKYIVIAVVVFICELALMLWPGKWIADDYSNYLIGEGSYNLDTNYDYDSVQQLFRARYSGTLDNIGIVLDGVNVDGKIDLAITDEKQKILYQQSIVYNVEDLNAYLNIPVHITVKKGREYYLSLILHETQAGTIPKVKVCGDDYELYENLQLFEDGEEIQHTQMLVKYDYSGVVPGNKALKAIAIALFTAMLILISIPQNKILRAAMGLVSFVGFPFIVGKRLEALLISESIYLPDAMKWNIALIFIIELLLVLILGSAKWGLVTSQILCTVVYSASTYMYRFRGAPFRINDLSAAGTAAKVIGGYNLTPDSHLAFVWTLAIAFVVLSWKSGMSITNLKIRSAVMVCGVAACLLSKHVLIDTDFLENQGFIYLAGISSLESYRIDGYLVATCFDIKNSRISKPEGYSSQKAEDILENYTQNTEENNTGTDREYPNIILIMNESFSDLRILGNLSVMDGFMDKFYGWKDNVIYGYVNVSSLGGGTANTEFEVLTGNSMGLLPTGSYAYPQYVRKPTESIASTLKEIGYDTYAMHPGNANNYNRKSAYELLEFDQSYWVSDFENASYIHGWVSDRDTYRKIEQIYEKKEDKPIFIFDVTMQNHGDYGAKGTEPQYMEYLQNVESEEANRYMALIQESSDAFAELVQYFEGKENTIICMFGDHQPLFADESFYEQVYAQTDGLTETDKTFNLYKTPFIIWANYDIPEQDNMDISANYLGALLLKTAEVPENNYFRFLIRQMEEYPVITANGYKDRDGNVYSWSGKNDEFPEYRILQYKYLFDK